jgi:carbamoyltransferase
VPLHLGLSLSHNGAACLLGPGGLAIAIQEERLSRRKRDRLDLRGPALAIDAVLAAAGATVADLASVTLAPLPSAAAPHTDPALHAALRRVPAVHRVPHHLAHAASAVAWHGGEGDAMVVVADGAGSELADLSPGAHAVLVGPPAAPGAREAFSIYHLGDGRLRPVRKQLAPPPAPARGLGTPLGPFASPGAMYQAVAQYLFGSWDAAGKVMGLAAFGLGRSDLLAPTAFWRPDGPAVVFHDGLSGAGGVLARRVGSAARPSPPLEREPVAIWLAASVQRALEALLLHLATEAARLADACRDEGGRPSRLLLAGGSFLNALANEAIVRAGLFDEVFIVPAAEDSGTALGAASLGAGGGLPGAAVPARVGLLDDALGPAPSDAALAAAALSLAAAGQDISRLEPAALADTLAADLDAGRVVALYDGRAELGPRALGHRSILFDPRREDARERMNFDVKRREGFRPFAPAVLADAAGAFFDLGPAPSSPWMLRVVPVRAERLRDLPGVVHVDGTARVQTVSNPALLLHRVLEAFAARTGVPVLVQTSFNVAGEPLVESPEDAARTFLGTAIDVMALGPWCVRRR